VFFASETPVTRGVFNRLLYLSFFGMDEAYHPTTEDIVAVCLSIQPNSNKIMFKSNPRCSAQNLHNFVRLVVHKRRDCPFLVWPGSLLSINEITEYKYFSPLKRSRGLKYKSELNIVPVVFIIEPNSFV